MRIAPLYSKRQVLRSYTKRRKLGQSESQKFRLKKTRNIRVELVEEMKYRQYGNKVRVFKHIASVTRQNKENRFNFEYIKIKLTGPRVSNRELSLQRSPCNSHAAHPPPFACQSFECLRHQFTQSRYIGRRT